MPDTFLGPSDAIPPTAPINLSAIVISSSQIILSWTASPDSGGSGLAGYRVYIGNSLIASVGPSTTVYSDTLSLTPSTTFTYYVVAFDGANNSSSPSNTASATTPASDAGSYPLAPLACEGPVQGAFNASAGAPAGNQFYCPSSGQINNSTYDYSCESLADAEQTKICRHYQRPLGDFYTCTYLAPAQSNNGTEFYAAYVYAGCTFAGP